MDTSLWQLNWFNWAIILAVIFPILVIILGEIVHRLKIQGRELANTFSLVRNLLLPVSIALLFLRYVLELDLNNQWLKLVQTLFWIVIINASLSLLKVILFADAKENTWQARVPKLLIDLTRVVIISIGAAVVAATVWNADLAGLATALGVSSIVIGLALQDTLGSIMSGVALLFERPFNVGDWLEIGGLKGEVVEMNWRSVRLRTYEQDMVVVPHLVMAREVIYNFNRPYPIHAERIILGFSYNNPPNLVKRVLMGIAMTTKGIVHDPMPNVRTLSYDDFAITYEVKAYIKDISGREEILDSFMTRVWYAARRNGLNIPFPIRTVHLYDGKELEAAQAPAQYTSTLEAVPAFVSMEHENLHSIAQDATLQHFAAGEDVIKEGDPGHALYIIIDGEALISVTDDKACKQPVSTLTRGEFFGAIALFSGTPSIIFVKAITDLNVIVLSEQVVQKMIEEKHKLALEIGHVIEDRRKRIRLIQRGHNLVEA